MVNFIKKRGQKFLRKFSRASIQAGEESKEHIKENLIERVSHIRNIKLLIFEWWLLVAALIMFAMTQAFWSSSSYSKTDFIDGGSYTEATIGRVGSLNPLFATTSSEKVLSKLLFNTLVAVDYSGNPGPALAESLVASENGKVWTIKLRDNLKWSDGEPLTNEDVMFTIGLIQDPAVNSIYDSNLENVKVVENEDGKIIFTLPSEYADFASALSIPIIPKHKLDGVDTKTLVENEFSTTPVTSGAFSFNATQISSTVDGEKVFYLSANPNYYLTRPMLSSFAVHTYVDKDAVIAALNAGSVTATAELSEADINKIVAENFEARETRINSGAFIFFNTTSSLMKKANLRTAIREGLDLEKLRALTPNTEALDFPLLESQIQLTEYPKIPSMDIDEAQAKINTIKADGELELNVATVKDGYFPEIADELVRQLGELGITAHLMVYDENQDFVTNVIAKRNYDILIYDVEMGVDPDPLPYYHSSQASTSGLNLSNYRNSLVDDLLIGARETMDLALRVKKYESFLEYWVKDVPAIGLYQENLTYIYNKNAKIYGDDLKLVTAIDRFSDIENWATVKGTVYLTP